MTGGFSSPDRSDGVQGSCSDTVESTGAKHPFGVLGGALKSSADDRPQGGHGDGLDTTISIAEPASKEGPEEGAGKVVHCDLESHMLDE